MARSLRKMILITSNAYRDREGEIISEVALGDDVDSRWNDEGEFIGHQPLFWWHDGEAIGEIIYADMEGPFLIEVAEELPNKVINAGTVDEPYHVWVSAIWDGMEKASETDDPQLGTSHGFHFNPDEFDDEEEVYGEIDKAETSVLPLWKAANLFTLAEVVR